MYKKKEKKKDHLQSCTKLVRRRKQVICTSGLLVKSSAVIVPMPRRGLSPAKDKSSSGAAEK